MAKKIAAGALFFLVTTSIFGIAIAKTKSIAKTTKCTKSNSSSHSGSNSSSWSYSSCSSGKNNDTQPVSRTIPVDWKTGIDYQYWAARNIQIYVNDTLVFKYPNDANNYTVYLMPDPVSYYSCQFNSAKLIANTAAGAGAGFSFVLKSKGYRSDPNYYFGCINHCKLGGLGMQLRVEAIPHY